MLVHPGHPVGHSKDQSAAEEPLEVAQPAAQSARVIALEEDLLCHANTDDLFRELGERSLVESQDGGPEERAHDKVDGVDPDNHRGEGPSPELKRLSSRPRRRSGWALSSA